MQRCRRGGQRRIFTARKGLAGRMGLPSDIAEVATWLCTDESRWLYGQSVVAEGGILLGVDYDEWSDENIDSAQLTEAAEATQAASSAVQGGAS